MDLQLTTKTFIFVLYRKYDRQLNYMHNQMQWTEKRFVNIVMKYSLYNSSTPIIAVDGNKVFL